MGKILLVLMSLLALSAQAGTYRWVDADGRVTYGDRPPPNGARLAQDADADGGGTPPASAGALPYAVRSVATKYPVHLYTGPKCEPCEAARAHLVQRGVPFSEKVLGTAGDLAEFKRLGFAESKVPALSVGPERLQGFGADTWNRLLDAAGYPKTSMLPRGWRPPAAEPLAPAGTQADAGRGTPGSVSASAPESAPSLADSASQRPFAVPVDPLRGAPPPLRPATGTSTSSIRF